VTCIAGIAQGGRVWLGADSHTFDTDNDEHWHLKDPKVFRNGEFGFGCAGHGRIGDLMRYAFVPPEQPSSMPDRQFLVTIFMTHLRAQLGEAGFLKNDSGVDEMPGTQMLMAYHGELYSIESDLQMNQDADGISTCGTGGMPARAALYALPKSMSPVTRLRKALEIAERISSRVVGPFKVISL